MTQQDIFTAALQITDPDGRAAYLAQACGADAELRRRVEILLRTHEGAGDFLSRPAVEQLAGDPSPLPGRQEDVTQPEGPAEDEGLDFLQPPSTPGALGRLGHYEVLELLGRGGFGIVVKAFDERLHRLVALKVLAPALAATSPARRRFLREARAAAAVRHDNVVAIYAVEEQPLPYLVMEYVEGETLQQRLDRRGPLDVPALLRIGRQIAGGLAAAHALRLIHRDIKPANILLERGSDRVKISDFGLARTADDASLSQSGFIAGTPLYMAPEQAMGEALDHRADLFSLGSVLYVMCSGRPPFRAPTTLAVLKRVAEDTPRPIRDIIPEVPEGLCALIARLQAKKPEDRFGSAQEVADLLAACGTGQQPPVGEPTLEFPRLAPAPRPASDGAARHVPPPARPRRRGRLIAAAALLLFAGWGLAEAGGVTDLRGVVIRLFSPAGTLVVQVDDPAVSVSIDGEDMVITGAGAKEIRLKPGQYTVQASKDGRVVCQELVRIDRDGRQVVRISKESVPLSDAEAWEKSVAGLPPEQQVEAVARRLKELNPGFDGKVESSDVRDGQVTGLAFYAHAVADLSPLRALPRLETLGCGGTVATQGKVADLSPLRGLPLKRLSCEDNPVSDLSPLAGMPLEELHCYRTQVEDLAPLKGMPLRVLEANRTRIADLSPLKGLPLTHLKLQGTAVSDLSPLKGMELVGLDVSYTGVTDLSPLKGMKLKFLDVRSTRVTNLGGAFQRQRDAEILRSLTTLERFNDKPAADFWKKEGAAWEKSVAGLPAEKQVEAVVLRLKELNPGFDGQVTPTIENGVVTAMQFKTNEVADVSPLHVLTGLVRLECPGIYPNRGKLSDLTPLRGLRLAHLDCAENPVVDLSPLRGMPLTALVVGDTWVSDLSPLIGMQLKMLTLQATGVKDLSPLRGMPLAWLDLAGSRGVSDLRPLKDLPLAYLNLSLLPVSDVSVLASMKSLRRLVLESMPVSDLNPLHGLGSLKDLNIKGTQVGDLGPLKGLPLQKLMLDYRAAHEEFVRSFKELEFINDKPAADFWKEAAGK
jgi:Leucine-rich repeat (LRR) protein